MGLVSPAAAGTAGERGDGYVAVIEVSGLLDEVLVDFVETQIDRARDPRPPARPRRPRASPGTIST